ncbi:MAG: endonuclease/exonuclease/phosphatase family protein [Thiotrichaceae bacterium]|nr:endonuclease/exonuclease/phosphatase family protein [Thiotrichaceae bacterium]
MLLNTNKLLIIIYLAVILEWLLDDKFIVIRYLHFGYTFFFIFVLGSFLYFIFNKPSKALWLIPALTFVAINFLSPFIPIASDVSKQQALNTKQHFKLLSFSINSRNKDYEQVSQLLENNPSQLVCLQEIPFVRYEKLKQLITKKLPNYYHVYSKKKSLMILSKQPIVPHKTMPFLKASTVINSKTVTIWNIHSPKALHKKEWQSYFFDRLQKDIDNDDSRYKIICGDFNSTPHNDIIRRLKHNFNAAYQQAFWPISFTYPSSKSFIATPLPFVKIDFFLLSKNINVLYYQRLKDHANSDHYPITTTIELQE